MHRIVCTLALAVALGSSTGCILPIYSPEPATRVKELIFTSDDLRKITEEWERIWFLDQPSHLTPIRTHGGII